MKQAVPFSCLNLGNPGMRRLSARSLLLNPKSRFISLGKNMKFLKSETSAPLDENNTQNTEQPMKHQRVWLSSKEAVNPSESTDRNPIFWSSALGNKAKEDLQKILIRIESQEKEGSRMRNHKKGVIREDPVEDMRLLIENYTVPALASALREREDVLQYCASLLADNKIQELSTVLRPFEQKYVERRHQREHKLDLTKGYNSSSLEMLRRGLMRMPRRVSQAHQRRAAVVLPLCNVHGVPCILFEKRSQHLRAHADEVCLPGGMVSSAEDRSIVSTCLREMEEEITGLTAENTTVLGVLRCNWGEVHQLVGVAVTPVVCYVGEIGDKDLQPNPNEVAECFTVPLACLLDSDRWIHKKDAAPIFVGGPHAIWGLTGYILNRFVKDILARYRVQLPDQR